MNRDARDILGLTSSLSIIAQKQLLTKALNAAVILCEEQTVMPPGFFLECQIAYEVVSKCTEFINSGLVILPRRDISLEHLIEKKRREYGSVRDKFEGLFDDNRVQILTDTQPYFIKRQTKIGETATSLMGRGS